MLVPMILLVPMMMFIVIEPDVDFEISHEESVAEVVWLVVFVKVVVDQAKEHIICLTSFVWQQCYHAGDVDAPQQRHQDERLDKHRMGFLKLSLKVPRSASVI